MMVSLEKALLLAQAALNDGEVVISAFETNEYWLFNIAYSDDPYGEPDGGPSPRTVSKLTGGVDILLLPSKMAFELLRQEKPVKLPDA